MNYLHVHSLISPCLPNFLPDLKGSNHSLKTVLNAFTMSTKQTENIVSRLKRMQDNFALKQHDWIC